MERAMLRAVGMALSYSGGRKGERARFSFLRKRKGKGPAVSSAGPLSSPFIFGRLSLRNHHRYSDCAAVRRQSGEGLRPIARWSRSRPAFRSEEHTYELQ